MLTKQKPVRSKKLRDSARGEQCTLRIPGVCCGDPETVVLAHPPVANGGMGTKGSDIDGAFACHQCHDVLDGRTTNTVPLWEVYECFIRGAAETRARMVERGLIKVEGAK